MREKKTNSRVEPTVFLMENYHFLWNFFLANFLGNPLLGLSEVVLSYYTEAAFLDWDLSVTNVIVLSNIRR